MTRRAGSTLIASAVAFLLAWPSRVPAQEHAWKFAVSGDSRNCGDVVMPAIAAGVKQSGAGLPENSETGLEFFVDRKAVYERLT